MTSQPLYPLESLRMALARWHTRWLAMHFATKADKSGANPVKRHELGHALTYGLSTRPPRAERTRRSRSPTCGAKTGHVGGKSLVCFQTTALKRLTHRRLDVVASFPRRFEANDSLGAGRAPNTRAHVVWRQFVLARHRCCNN